MRAALAKWQNQIVSFNGWYVSTRFEGTWLCLKNVYIIPWDMDSSMQDMAKTPGGAKFDHIWLSPDDQDFKNMTTDNKNAYKRVSSVGIVRKYKRDNGTWDYTVKSVPKYSIEDCVDKLNRVRSSLHRRLKLIDYSVDIIDRHRKGDLDSIVFGIAWSVSQFYDRIIEEQKELRASVNAQIEKEKTVLKNGRCKNLDQAKFASKARK
jgi:hypothetical protein